MKYYTVFRGHVPGVYDNWDEARLQVDGFPGAVVKSFKTSEEASEAFRKYTGVEDRRELFRLLTISNQHRQNNPVSAGSDNPEVDWDAWAVDAACAGNPGKMEYRGVDLRTGKVIFQMGPFEDATNNIGEFLALVHAMALMARKGEYHNIYSDSLIAQKWVRNLRPNTKLKLTEKNAPVFVLLQRAQAWLQTHRFPMRIMKWQTDRWGEIPADYGRK